MTPYTKEELDEIVRYHLWSEPKRRNLDRSKHFVASGQDTPAVPNWAYISKRNQWVTTFRQVTLVASKELIGSKWQLYLGGEVKLGEPGTLEEMKERGTALLIVSAYGGKSA